MFLRTVASRAAAATARANFSASTQRHISTVGIVGLGSMGHGLVHMCAESGYDVVAVEADGGRLLEGIGAVEKSVRAKGAKAVKKGTMTENDAENYINTTLHRIEGHKELSAVADCDLVIEAIVENLDIKKAFYKDLAATTRDDCILATNTSSFPVAEMAAAGDCADRMVGLHYFNPVQVMKLVEVISLPETQRAHTEAVLEFVKKTGKTSVECGDTAGFVVNRLLVPYIVQGIALVARGDATPEAVDTAMRLGAGHPMGPITLSDYVGNDINLACMEGWQKAHPDNPAFQVPEAMELLREMVADGKLGRKTGHGFYKWEGNKPVGPRDDGWTPGPK